MKRAIFVALGTGLVITSAAALDIVGSRPDVRVAHQGDPVAAARARDAARAEQRDRIHARYLVEREQCALQSGHDRESCVVKAHAGKGRALLEAAAPYEARF